jgi:hypothetical protein
MATSAAGLRDVASRALVVRVNNELVLDAGSCVVDWGKDGLERRLIPPRRTLFEQVLAYLEEKPDPWKTPSGSMTGREGIAAAAVALRWGSYLSVLLDHDKPEAEQVATPGASRISDGEMARINIEASAGLAEWIDIYRERARGGRYEKLVNRAVAYLPMPLKRSRSKMSEFCALADPQVANLLTVAAHPERLARARADAERHPSRVLANAVVNTAWRNGPVEDLHAGSACGYPLDACHATLREERELMTFAAERFALGMSVCLSFAMDEAKRRWPDQVLPYGLADMLLITPSGWSLTEDTRGVTLPAERPVVLH